MRKPETIPQAVLDGARRWRDQHPNTRNDSSESPCCGPVPMHRTRRIRALMKCTRDDAGRITPCPQRFRIGPSEYAHGKAVHCAYCDAFLRLYEPTKGLK